MAPATVNDSTGPPTSATALIASSVVAVAALLRYASENLSGRLGNITRLVPYVLGGGLQVDDATRRNLELTQTLRGEKAPTLLSLIDSCQTGMGSRTLRHWLTHPPRDRAPATARQTAIAALLAGAAGMLSLLSSQSVLNVHGSPSLSGAPVDSVDSYVGMHAPAKTDTPPSIDSTIPQNFVRILKQSPCEPRR